MKNIHILILFLICSFSTQAAPKDPFNKSLTILVTAKESHDSVTFTIYNPKMPQWISYPSGVRFEQILSATLESKSLTIPLAVYDPLRCDNSVQFTLPKSMLKNAKLNLRMSVGFEAIPAQESREIDLEKVLAITKEANKKKPTKMQKSQ